ncbi:hypothetical protein YC2023_020391 [Brassica napus]
MAFGVDQVIVTANKIDIVAYLTAIFDLIKLALVGNQAQSKLGEAERKAENLKNQAQVSQNHCVGVQKVKRKVELAQQAVKCLMNLDPDDTCGYVLLTNIYSSFGLLEEAVGQRVLMKERQLEKEIVCSSMETKFTTLFLAFTRCVNWEASALKSEGTAQFSDHLGHLKGTILSDAIA